MSVLTPVLNEAPFIRETVASMQTQTFDGPVEFVFLDGGSQDGTRALLADLAATDPRIRLLENPAGTVPHALNIGLAQTSGELVARMDAHTRYPPDYLAIAADRLDAGDVACVTGPALATGTDAGSRRVALALRSALGVGGATFRKAAAGEVEVDSGFTGMWRRSTLQALGGWDEGWPVNQDAELAARIRASGGRIVCRADMSAGYVPRASLGALARQYWRYGQYRIKTTRRHPDSLRRSHLLPPALVLALLAAIAGPGPLRRRTHPVIAFYLLVITLEGARLASRSRTSVDAVLLPAIFATMHLAWGAGFLIGCARFGFPGRAIGRTTLATLEAALERASSPGTAR